MLDIRPKMNNHPNENTRDYSLLGHPNAGWATEASLVENRGIF